MPLGLPHPPGGSGEWRGVTDQGIQGGSGSTHEVPRIGVRGANPYAFHSIRIEV
jgi:hypothetical protein